MDICVSTREWEQEVKGDGCEGEFGEVGGVVNVDVVDVVTGWISASTARSLSRLRVVTDSGIGILGRRGGSLLSIR